MPWIDGHLDLAYLAVCGRDLTQRCPDRRTGCVSLPELRAAEVDLVFGTIFTEPDPAGSPRPFTYRGGRDRRGAEAAGLRQLAVYLELERQDQIAIVRRRPDLDGPAARPQVVLLMEGADPILQPEDARAWHRRGVRMVGLTWAAGTRYAGGNARPGHLSAEGRALVASLDELGIVHDASHLADAALDDLLGCATGPVVATHSNCRALVDPSQRHLADDQIRAIADRGGVIGLNLYGPFLATGRRATVEDCLAHLEHVANVAGTTDAVALGSDMDGGFGPADLPEELDHPTRLGRLTEALASAGWADEDIEAFAWGNWHRLLQRTLPP